ncbi:MAG: cytochrome c [Gemmatimonadota bacterium]|nr:cytochrome c [Gemmatimonadota bacterium]
MSRTTPALAGALAAVVGLAVAGLVVLYAGWYDVSATSGHADLTERVLGALQHRSVSARAGDLDVTLPTDSAALEHGFVHYDAMCVDCHGAPGVERGETGKGMSPTPPDLAEEAEEWSDAELFWITKHGIKLAGMPAYGPTHSDEELLGIVAFVRRLPQLDSAAYAARRAAADSAGIVHVHADGSTHVH